MSPFWGALADQCPGGWQLLCGCLTPVGPLANLGWCKGWHFFPTRAVHALGLLAGGGQPCITLHPAWLHPPAFHGPVGHTVSATASENPSLRADRVPCPSAGGGEGGGQLCARQMVVCSSCPAELSGLRGCPAAQAARSLANAAPHPASLGQCSRTSSSKPASSSRSSGPVSSGLVVGWQVRFWMSGFPGGTSGKDPACQCRRQKRHGFNPEVGKIPWRRTWQPTPVFLHGESHGQRSLAGCSPWGLTESDRKECIHSKV